MFQDAGLSALRFHAGGHDESAPAFPVQSEFRPGVCHRPDRISEAGMQRVGNGLDRFDLFGFALDPDSPFPPIVALVFFTLRDFHESLPNGSNVGSLGSTGGPCRRTPKLSYC